MDDLIGDFLSETSESLAALERALAEQPRQPMQAEGWATAARLMHTIKGTCGFLPLPTMEAVASASQEMLERFKSGGQPSETELTALRTSMAKIRYMMDYLAAHGSEPSLQEVAAQAPPPPALKNFAQLNEQVHRAAELPNPSQAVAAIAPPAAATEERISVATLASLVLARNELKHLAQSNPRVRGAQAMLDRLIGELKEKLLPRTPVYPRLAKLLMVESGGLRFALQAGQIREVARIGSSQRHASLDEGAMISLRGSWLPRLSLAQKLGQGSSAGEAYAIVVECDGKRLALCVEGIGALEELMLQKVPTLLRGKSLYEAAAILGDGSPCLILSPAGLLAHAVQTVRPPIAPAEPVQEAAPVSAPSATSLRTTLPFLLFEDGNAVPRAIPLADVARVEHLRAEDIAAEGQGYAAACRGEILRLRLLPGGSLPERDIHAITLLDAPQVGLIAHRMGGILESRVTLPAAGAQPILLRTELDGAMTEIVNARAYLTEASHG